VCMCMCVRVRVRVRVRVSVCVLPVSRLLGFYSDFIGVAHSNEYANANAEFW